MNATDAIPAYAVPLRKRDSNLDPNFTLPGGERSTQFSNCITSFDKDNLLLIEYE